MKKKLCVLTTVSGTMESFVIPAMRVFVSHGFDVTLICNMGEEFKAKYRDEFHLINMPMKRGISLHDLLFKPITLYKIFKKEKFDYVQYATTNAAWYASVAAWMARIPIRVNCLWGLLYTASAGWKRKFYWVLEKVPCLFSTHFTVASHKNLQIAVKDHLCSYKNASVVGSGGTIGVDLTEFDITRRKRYREEIEQQYKCLKGKTVFGFVGRIDVDKGINELLTSFMQINDDTVALLLVGPIDSLRCGVDETLLSKAKSCDNIIFTGYTNQVSKYMSAIDILVHPTYREGFSMVIQQGMAMGCSIITTNIPGPSEVIEENRCGLLVPVKNPNELASAMLKLKDDSNIRNEFVARGLERVRKYFNRRVMLQLTYKNRCEMMGIAYSEK